MKYAFVSLIKWIVLTVFATSFFTVLVGAAVIKQYPENVIGFVQQFIPVIPPAPLTIKGIGVLGDSQSDEYRADDARGINYEAYTKNWLELLVDYRKINAGSWDTRDEPRRTGYEYNWARTGATARSMIASGQHIGLADQVKNGEVNVVIIYIGANDFAPYLTPDGYDTIYEGRVSDAAVIEKAQHIVADITTAIDTLRVADPKVRILLVKIPNWDRHLGVQIGFPIPEKRERVTKAIHMTNDELEFIATRRNIPTIDPNQFYEELRKSSPDGKIHVGDVILERLLLNNDPKNQFLDDGVHPGTIMNALFANYLMRNLNQYTGTKLKPFSEDEILNFVGLGKN